ncbi:MAG TPA: hypothetical protein VN642_11955 [Dongiaceae bacterium]|nr:hypothetical protein [Dongiaceae bacterium]
MLVSLAKPLDSSSQSSSNGSPAQTGTQSTSGSSDSSPAKTVAQAGDSGLKEQNGVGNKDAAGSGKDGGVKDNGGKDSDKDKNGKDKEKDDKDKPKDKDGQEQQTSSGDKKDAKPKKNYCN